MSLKFTDEVISKLFGSEDAESESIERLKEYFFKKDTYLSVTSNLKLRLLVGHKGTGKSALFKIAISEDVTNNNLSVLIKPDDIDGIATEKASFNERIRQWKNGLLSIVREKVFATFNLKDDSNEYISKSLRIVSFLHDTFTKLNTNANLEPSKKMLCEKFLKKQQIVVYIDDLDRGWSGTYSDIERISALLNAARDLSNENEGLLFKISLRTDVYYLVRTSDESTDKIQGSVVWCDWENHEIFVLLIKRILTYFGDTVDEEELLRTPQSDLITRLDSVMETTFYGKGKWSEKPMYNVLLSMVRRRPRDIVKLCSLAAKKAYQEKTEKIYTRHFNSVFSEYSNDRIQDTINEYKSELPNIKELIFGMKPTSVQKRSGKGFIYTSDELFKKIRSIINANQSIKDRNGNKLTEKQIAQFLYKIGFLTATKQTDNAIDRKYFATSQYLLSANVDFGYNWEVHPAFRWALQPDFDELIYST